jgi:Uma2 family endonuclease
MIADCDQRTSKLIEKEVQRELERQYGSIYQLTLLKIQHENDQVNVIGEFTARPGEEEKRFTMTMPRVDGPLDHFV